MSLFYLLDHIKRDRPIRLASEIAGKPLTSYKPLLNDPEIREDGNSDPTPAELLERLAEVHAGMATPLTGPRRRRDEGYRDYDVPEIKLGPPAKPKRERE